MMKARGERKRWSKNPSREGAEGKGRRGGEESEGLEGEGKPGR